MIKLLMKPGTAWRVSVLALVVSAWLAGCAGGAAPVAPSANPAAQNMSLQREADVEAAIDDRLSVYFSFGAARVAPDQLPKVDQLAQRLKADPKLIATLIGHTDDLGSSSYNLAIAERRVNAVFVLLRERGIPVAQLHRFGVGNEKTSPACKSESCRAKMRRVEVTFNK